MEFWILCLIVFSLCALWAWASVKGVVKGRVAYAGMVIAIAASAIVGTLAALMLGRKTEEDVPADAVDAKVSLQEQIKKDISPSPTPEAVKDLDARVEKALVEKIPSSTPVEVSHEAPDEEVAAFIDSL